MITQLLQDGPWSLCPFSQTVNDQFSLTSTNDAIRFPLAGFPEWKVTQLNSSKAIENYAEQLDGLNNFWLKERFLHFLIEEPQGVGAGALVLQHQDGTSIVVSMQLFRFSAGSQIRQEADEQTRIGFRQRISRLFSFPVLTLGQFMVSGRDGWSGTPASLNPTFVAELIHHAGEAVAARIGKIPAVLIKDLAALNTPLADAWQDQGYYQLPVDPSMQLSIRKWSNMDDYLMDINSKYRVRYRRARKMAEGVVCQELSNLEVTHYNDHLHQLYRNIKAEAAFDAISLSPNYFAELKERFTDECRIFGYFYRDQLIGFRTTLANGPTLHAHYLGFEQELNRELHLYHNILFDLLEEAIDGGYQKLDYGRTALEIKSTIGAEPVHYCCGLRGRTPFVRWIIRQFTPALFKASEWEQRRPLK